MTGKRPPVGKNVDRALEIDDRRKKVVALRRQGASISEIARTLDISAATASSDLTAEIGRASCRERV